MFYLDASVVVTALANEAATDRTQAWLRARPPGATFISDWVAAEVSSALSIKIRTGQITVAARARILMEFNRMAREELGLVDVRTAHFRSAALFADQHALNLRAGDALHLAITSDHGLTLSTLDRRLAEAGPALGVQTVLI